MRRLALGCLTLLLSTCAPALAIAQSMTQKCTPYQLTVSLKRRPDSVAFAAHCRELKTQLERAKAARIDSVTKANTAKTAQLARAKFVKDSTAAAVKAAKLALAAVPCYRYITPLYNPPADTTRCYAASEVDRAVVHGALSWKGPQGWQIITEAGRYLQTRTRSTGDTVHQLAPKVLLPKMVEHQNDVPYCAPAVRKAHACPLPPKLIPFWEAPGYTGKAP